MAKIFPPIAFLTSEACFRLRPNAEELRVMQFLESSIGDEYEVFFRPFLNGLRPSLVLYRPEAGVLIFDLFDRTEYLKKTNPKVKFTTQKYELIKLTATAKDQLTHDRSLSKAINGVCLVDASTQEVSTQYKDVSYYSVVAYEDLFRGETLGQLLHSTKIRYDTAFFIVHILQEIRRYLKPSLHRLEEGKPFTPNAKQKELMVSQPGPQRVKGVAGSGKTSTLAHKAVNANLRHKSEVLIVCFNITIQHYIRSKIEGVMANFIRSDFHLTHYHDFFRHQALEFMHTKPQIGAWEDETYFDRIAYRLPKYATIIVDEAQDYQREWVVILKKYFLQPAGELAVFFDVNQDIYERKSANTFPLPGRPHEMRKSYRLSTSISELCNKFLAAYRADEEEDGGDIEVLPEQTSFEYNEYKGGITYSYFPADAAAADLYEHIRNHISTTDTSPDDIAVLSTSIEKLRVIEHLFRTQKGENTTRMFESEEEHAVIAKRHLPEKPFDYRMQLRDLRRGYKLRKFDLKTGLMKFSSVHSFKGWEMHTVYLLLDKSEEQGLEDSGAPQKAKAELSWQLVYTGLSRARHQLNIINVGDRKYHDFFEGAVNGRKS
ncbi:AAA family ATPase [Hymenobacter sp. J193]|uniref:AAA family ATPase n=1 Tax=Hymenobacter sp. J193 TaxID=2898429 RepID=UPI002151229B|nr:AAA family ATPase [Hymenobacter sp. J193]MCR5888341.1 AAA family ATPase [Hymenobacter sp. J193]